MTVFELIFILALLCFWSILAEFSVQSMAAGLAAVLLVYWLNRDLVRSLAGRIWRFSVGKAGIILWFGLSLLWQVILANIDVARIVLSPKMPLQPTIVTFNPGLKTDLGKTVLANSITLTPGTLTLRVDGDQFTVHALTLAAAQNIVEWPLIARLRRMEEGL